LEAQIPLIGDAEIGQISADFEMGRFEIGSYDKIRILSVSLFLKELAS